MENNNHKDPDTLKRLYHEEGLTQEEIADKFGVARSTITYHMDKKGVELRDKPDRHKGKTTVNYASVYTNESGYEKWVVWNPNTQRTEELRVHRLLAVAEYGFEAVCDNDVHHKNDIPWDNRPDNIRIMDPSEHIGMHHRGEKSATAKLTEEDVKEIKWLLADSDLTQKEIGARFGVSRGPVKNIANGVDWKHVEL